MARRASHLATANYWPSFVDALSALVLVLVYLISAFLLVEFFLSNVIHGKDTALEQLRREIAQLSEVLALERAANEDLRTNAGRLTATLQAQKQESAVAQSNIQALQQALAERDQRLAQLEQQAGNLREQAEAQQSRAAELNTELEAAQERTNASRAEVQQLNEQVAALREQLKAIAAALELSESQVTEKNAKIQDLGQRLNVALAKRVEELSKYRSEFFAKLSKILGGREDIRVVGDRFVFQSEVLFPIGSADITADGKQQLTKVADAVLAIKDEIPPEIPWVLRIDGHTDSVPIHNERFASNWELSLARAMSVVRFLIDQGVPPERLAPTGFGEYQPLVASEPGVPNPKNRRIEIKLTER